jgi:general secretion pathway protein B
MSLILEALRKSEAERRRGQAPDLRTELPPVAPPRAHALPRWSWAVFAAALLALAWLLLARPGAAPPDDPSSTPEDAAAPVAAAASAAKPATGQARDAGPGLQGRRIVVDPAAALPQESATAPRPGPASPAAAPASTIAGGSGGPSSAAAGTGAGAGTGAPATADAGDGSARSASAAPAAPFEPSPAMPPPAAPAQPAASRPDARLLALSDLSAEERRQLPPLKLSMHMWSQDPARRFVILDGQRLAEGDRAGPAVIDAIRSDDVVLAWNGMRLRLSLR